MGVHRTSGIPSSAEYMHEGTRPSGLSGAIQGASSFPSTVHSTQIRSLTDVHLGFSCQLSFDRIDWLASIADCGCRNRAQITARIRSSPHEMRFPGIFRTQMSKAENASIIYARFVNHHVKFSCIFSSWAMFAITISRVSARHQRFFVHSLHKRSRDGGKSPLPI